MFVFIARESAALTSGVTGACMTCCFHCLQLRPGYEHRFEAFVRLEPQIRSDPWGRAQVRDDRQCLHAGSAAADDDDDDVDDDDDDDDAPTATATRTAMTMIDTSASRTATTSSARK